MLAGVGRGVSAADLPGRRPAKRCHRGRGAVVPVGRYHRAGGVAGGNSRGCGAVIPVEVRWCRIPGYSPGVWELRFLAESRFRGSVRDGDAFPGGLTFLRIVIIQT